MDTSSDNKTNHLPSSKRNPKYIYEKNLKERRRHNFISLHRNRELQEVDWRIFTRQMQVTGSLIERLGLSKELEGHSGCVNCIEFNENGNLIISGSDDFNIILWDVHQQRKLRAYRTGHRGNIFSVKFLPQTNDSLMVSGAGDYRIEVRELESGEATQVCTCHAERVKRIATIPATPNIFFSAAEDGTVMQFDTRKKHICSTQPNNVLINLRQHAGRTTEAKCVTCHPISPEYIAVGASDPYIRIYDRRMIKLTSVQYPPGGTLRTTWERNNYTTSQPSFPDNLSPGCVQYYVPGHLPDKHKEYHKKYRSLATTYLSYSTDGTHLLANLGGDHIYLFDTLQTEVPKKYSAPFKKSEQHLPKASFAANSNGVRKVPETSNGFTIHPNHLTEGKDGMSAAASVIPDFFPEQVQTCESKAMEAFAVADYTGALEFYNMAIYLWEYSPSLFVARATTRLRRKWDGDFYAALRDCDQALYLEPTNVKAKFKQLQCLHLLNRNLEAKVGLEDFLEHNLQLGNTPVWNELQKEIFKSKSNHSSSSDEDVEETMLKFTLPTSSREKEWKAQAKDYTSSFCGHCNTTTDIKEAVFLGSQGHYIAAGSDDGNLFIWDRKTTNLIRVIGADGSIVNCVQSHPNICMLATSGIESVVKLWSPQHKVDQPGPRTSLCIEEISRDNQMRMRIDPLEMMIMPMGELPQPFGLGSFGDLLGQMEDDQNHPNMQCRTN